MKGGRFQNTAYLRTLASKQAQNFATRRLIRDMKDMEDNEIPTINVSATPLEDDLFVWHANLVGPKDTLYEGSVYHIEIRIPETYPMQPPTLNFKTPIHHPNAFVNPDGTYRLCLDLTEVKAGNAEGGWNSAYSIMSILIQLQSFLIEGSEKYLNQKAAKKDADIDKITEFNQVANDYKCTCCKHKGRGDPFPKIRKIEEFQLDQDFKTVKDEEQLYNEGLRCFHSKLGLDETHLGIGLKVTTIARNGEINQCNPILDYISLKSFYKNGIRRSVNNETFGYWMPLYFKRDQKDKTLALAKKALSFICTNNSNRFEQKMVGKVMLKCISTTIMKIIEQKRHPSVLIIRHLLNFHVLLLLFVREYPEIVQQFDQEIEKFISSEENRIKKNCPNLALVMVYLLFSEKYKFEDVIKYVNEEQLDRQVFWILKKIPELEDDSGTIAVDENRVRVTFNSQIMGYLLVCFYHDYIKILRGKFKTWVGMLEFMEGKICKLDDETENKIQQAFFNTEETIKDYKDYYQHIGVDVKNFDDICQRLKEAVKNSKRKKYHGSIDELLGLPSNDEQSKLLNSKREDLTDLITDGKLIEFSDTQWKDKCLKRWPWMRRYISFDYERAFTPADIAEHVDEFSYEYSLLCEDHIDVSKVTRGKFNFKTATSHRPRFATLYNEKFSWRELFIKLDFEENTRMLNFSEDFKSFYAKVPIVAQYLSTVVIYVSKCDNLKSGFYYLAAILKLLKGVKGLKLKSCCVSNIPYKALNNIKKGLSSTGTEPQSKIEYVEISNCTFDLSSTSQECLYQIFEQLPNINSFKVINSNILQSKNNKLVTSILTNHSELRELYIEKSITCEAIGKSLADGLMRTKKLESVTVINNQGMAGNSISNILYNLSFAPRLTYLDCSGNNSTNFNDLIENIGKMISINASIETLVLNNVPGLMNSLNLDFFKFVAENQSLRVLSFDNSKTPGSAIPMHVIQYMAQALAINCSKKGKIRELYLGNGIMHNFSYLDHFMTYCYYSNQLVEQWYGDSTKASKMGGDDLTNHFVFNLEVLDISRCAFSGVFSYEKFKKQIQRSLPTWTRLFRVGSSLHSLNLGYSGINSHFCEILHALYEVGVPSGYETYNLPLTVQSKLIHLNLEHNPIQKEGAKHLKEALKLMPTLQVLNLSHIKLGVSGAYSINEVIAESKSLKQVNLFCNKYDVDGARSLAKAIEKNTSIEYIDIGYNRIRDEGFKNIISALKANTQNKIRCIGLKSNYLRDTSFELLMKHIQESSGPLTKVVIKKNLVSQYLLNTFKEKYDKLGETYYVDVYNKFDYNEEDKLRRSIWIHPFPANSIPAIYNFLTRIDKNERQVGIVLNIRVRKGNDYPNRKKGEAHLFVEFAHELSVEKALVLASKKKFIINNVNLRVFRAGSSTYFYSPHCRVKNSKTNIARVPAARGGARPARPAGRGGRGGRR